MNKSAIHCPEIIYCIAFVSISLFSFAPSDLPLQSKENDTTLVNTLLQESTVSFASDPSKAIALATQAKELAEQLNFPKGIAYALKTLATANYYQGKYLEALEHLNQSLKIFNEIDNKVGISNIYNNIGVIYYDQGDDVKALDNYLQSLKYAELSGDKLRMLSSLNNIGGVYYNRPTTHDKALKYFLLALPLCEALNKRDELGAISVNIGRIYSGRKEHTKAIMYFNNALTAYGNLEGSLNVYNAMGEMYSDEKNFELAIQNHIKALNIAEKTDNKLNVIKSLLGLGSAYEEKGSYKNALVNYKKAEIPALQFRANSELKEIYNHMAISYSKLSDYRNAFKYQSLFSSLKDTLYNIADNKKLMSLQFDFDLKTKQNEINYLKQDNVLRDTQLKKEALFRKGLFGGLTLVLIIAFIQWRHSKQRQKANLQLQLHKRETEQQKEKAERALDELKSTQSQLIQSEKMASLGELTAGIAHEIQNPLNFVNNFSEINRDLLVEMQEEIEKGNLTGAKLLSKDIEENQEKINHHGKRADAIVKGMLQHSRSSSGIKEPTDINALCEEYLRLSYHGLRAKDNSFNAKLETSFDHTVGKINIIPQDIGRVILNLINNAFYAISEKRKQSGENYEPILTVSTKKSDNSILISVKDNGNGIPLKVADKIFQPFFTTKPTGQGTGLGLSLSYDIIKATGGELKMETKEGEFAEFVILLPFKNE